jgi:hypothetical protein
MDVLADSDSEYHIKFHICNKAINFRPSLAVVYEPAHEESKDPFLHEFINLAKDNSYSSL